MNQAIAKPAVAPAAAAGATKPALRIWPRPSFALATLAVVLTAVLVEGLLVFRVWVQLSGSSLNNLLLKLFYWLSSQLIAPFRGLETTTSGSSRILELSTIVALEVYLVGAVIALGGLALARALLDKSRAPAASAVAGRAASGEGEPWTSLLHH